MARPDHSGEAQIRAYKEILSEVLDQRPSGTRQRLADAIGKHRSFITQMTSTSYATPIPQKHLTTILSVCHFSPAERDAFLAAYGKAHRIQPAVRSATNRTRHLSLLVPDLGDDNANATLDKAVNEFMLRIGGLLKKGADE